EGQLAFARTRAAAKLAEFRLGDAQALPFPDKSFDAAAMALVISFIPDPAKAVAEMARVVRPGGIVATYMWDIPGGGLGCLAPPAGGHPRGAPLPLAPVGRAFKAMDKEYSRTSDNASRREVMQTLWQGAGLREVETRVIRITVDFTSFDDFCDSSLVPVGPAGQVIAKMSPAELEELKAHLRKLLPIAADGSIAYEAFANAVKGRVPSA